MLPLIFFILDLIAPGLTNNLALIKCLLAALMILAFLTKPSMQHKSLSYKITGVLMILVIALLFPLHWALPNFRPMTYTPNSWGAPPRWYALWMIFLLLLGLSYFYAGIWSLPVLAQKTPRGKMIFLAYYFGTLCLLALISPYLPWETLANWLFPPRGTG